MSSQQLNEIEKRMRQFDDHALLRLVAVEIADFEPTAIEIARSELRRRGLDEVNTEEYYEQFPLERILPNGFCVRCYSETTDESPGNTYSANFVGTRLIGFDRCSICGSIRQKKWLCFFVPIIPLEEYRVVYLERDLLNARYIGRKLKK